MKADVIILVTLYTIKFNENIENFWDNQNIPGDWFIKLEIRLLNINNSQMK